MKKYISILLMSLFVVSCAQQEMYYSDVESIFYAEIEQPVPSDLTKTYYDTDSDKVLWDNGDLLTLFTGTSAPLQYKFVGGTGVTGGKLVLFGDSGASSGDAINHNYAVYPYSEDNGLDGNENIVIKTSGVQTYPGFDSFGENDNIMVAASDNTSFSFKNVCGWIILGLSGEGQVSSITLRGNNDEIIAGDLAITTTIDGDPTVSPRIKGTKFTNLKEITLTCPEPVTLSSTATDFWIAVPPTVFSNGFTFTVTDPDGKTCTKNLSFSYEVQRSKYRRIATTITYPEAVENIVFADENIKAALVSAFDTNSDGELSLTEAAAVTSLEGVFGDTKTYTSFDEFQYFTGVTSIPSYMFSDWQIASITIPDGVTEIGSRAFWGCSNLTSISIPDGVTRIEESLLRWCSNLSSIIIPSGVTSIGAYAFDNCSSLTSITLPDGLTSIGSYAFFGSGLTSIIIPESVTRISNDTFFACRSLTNITIPNGVTDIGAYAFYNCINLENVTFPEELLSIGSLAFLNCKNLTSVTIPENVESIGEGVFAFCDNLSEFSGKFSSSDRRSLIVDGTLMAFAPSNLSSYTIPSGVTGIGYLAFGSCSSLTSIILPESLTAIGNYAFSKCNNISSIVIPEGVKTIGEDAFEECANMISIVLPTTLTGISSAAFAGCSELKSVTLPESLTDLGLSAFFNCTSLTNVVVSAVSPPQGGANMFYGTNNSPIYVPQGSVEAYKAAEYWSDYADRIFAIGAPQAVDLGLSVKWASFNLGATAPEECGDYFSWGEIATKPSYSWSNYAWGSSSVSLTKYVASDNYGIVDGDTKLNADDDAASIRFGNQWRIPTDEEWSELYDNTKMTWTWDSTKQGYIVKSKIEGYEGNSIFLPAAGYSSSYMIGYSGYYWASSLYLNSEGEYNSSLGSGVSFNEGGGGRLGMSRERGCTIRAVFSD